ncbi:hypothetical protein AB0N73_14135 [Microbacterium sp. NPDC089189]|uniref:hypothetical protein n=1 Tax=Microbacterium sp. NPDC089189 TaxID=3154972 RepID=UPI0034456619
MKRPRLLLALGPALLALALVPTAPSAVGASFTDATDQIAAGSVGTAVVAPLTGGTAVYTADGVAHVSWDDPGAARAYSVARNVGSWNTITPSVSVADGRVSFTDDLTVPRGGGCAPGWAPVGTDRCAPGSGATVEYSVGSTLSGWTPPTVLSVTAAYQAPSITGAPGPITRSGNELSSSFTVTNSSSVPVTIRLQTRLQVGAGGLIRFAVQPRGTSGCTATHCWSENVVDPGVTLPGIIDWRNVDAGTVLQITVGSPDDPDAVIEFIAP